jgi:DNA-binding phage protein
MATTGLPWWEGMTTTGYTTSAFNGEADAARLVLRDLVNATFGFEALAAETAKSAKSLHRMLSINGAPTMDNLAAIHGAVRKKLGVEIQAHAAEAALSGREPRAQRLPLSPKKLSMSRWPSRMFTTSKRPAR